MTQGLHIAGHADDQVVDLVIAEPKGRVLGLYRGANGEIAITAAEARFLLEALPAMIARAECLDHMAQCAHLKYHGIDFPLGYIHKTRHIKVYKARIFCQPPCYCVKATITQ